MTTAEVDGEPGTSLFRYERHIPDGPWFQAKGPIAVDLRSCSTLGLDYMLEGFDESLGLIYEDLKLGDSYVRRYFVVASAPDGASDVTTIGVHSLSPLSEVAYKSLRRSTSQR